MAALDDAWSLRPTLTLDVHAGFIRERAYAGMTQPSGLTPSALGMNLFNSPSFPGIYLYRPDTDGQHQQSDLRPQQQLLQRRHLPEPVPGRRHRELVRRTALHRRRRRFRPHAVERDQQEQPGGGHGVRLFHHLHGFSERDEPLRAVHVLLRRFQQPVLPGQPVGPVRSGQGPPVADSQSERSACAGIGTGRSPRNTACWPISTPINYQYNASTDTVVNSGVVIAGNNPVMGTLRRQRLHPAPPGSGASARASVLPGALASAKNLVIRSWRRHVHRPRRVLQRFLAGRGARLQRPVRRHPPACPLPRRSAAPSTSTIAQPFGAAPQPAPTNANAITQLLPNAARHRQRRRPVLVQFLRSRPIPCPTP